MALWGEPFFGSLLFFVIIVEIKVDNPGFSCYYNSINF